MVLSRSWYLILSGAAILGVAAALLAASLINDQWQRAATSDLIRDRFEVEALLKLDARTRLDAIAPIAANPDVRTALRRAGARRADTPIDPEITTALGTKLAELNGQLAGMRGELLFAVDRDGWIVGSVAPSAIPEGAGLGEFPVVRRALEGYIRDDVWVYNDGVYRMAARPVIDGGQYVGALIHGKRFDDELAELLSTRLVGASIGFFHGDAMFAGYMPTGVQSPPRRDDMGALLAGQDGQESILTDEALLAGNRTEPQELPTGGLAIYSLVTGTARHANVGYSVGRPGRSLAQPQDILDLASGEAWGALPWIPLGAAGFGVFLIAMFLVWVERDRPLSKLRRATKALEGSPENRLTITDFGGRYRKIANDVNEALDRAAHAGGGAASKRKAANLDQILGPSADQAPPSGSFFGFASQEQAGAVDLPEVPPASTPMGGGGAPAIAGGLPPMGGAPPQLPSPPAARPAPPRPPPPKPPPPKPQVAAHEPPSRPVLAESDESEEPTTVAGLPPEAQAVAARAAQPAATATPAQRKKLKRTLMGVAPPTEDDDEDEDDGATMVARVPRELLNQSAGDDGEASHFREVFDQFLAMKQKCGESTAGLTFEKFVVTLRKNRDQIVARHGAAKVRFTVYEKAGKAALKATPIKE